MSKLEYDVNDKKFQNSATSVIYVVEVNGVDIIDRRNEETRMRG